jgi:hypothetical protein
MRERLIRTLSAQISLYDKYDISYLSSLSYISHMYVNENAFMCHVSRYNALGSVQRLSHHEAVTSRLLRSYMAQEWLSAVLGLNAPVRQRKKYGILLGLP